MLENGVNSPLRTQKQEAFKKKKKVFNLKSPGGLATQLSRT